MRSERSNRESRSAMWWAPCRTCSMPRSHPGNSGKSPSYRSAASSCPSANSKHWVSVCRRWLRSSLPGSRWAACRNMGSASSPCSKRRARSGTWARNHSARVARKATSESPSSTRFASTPRKRSSEAQAAAPLASAAARFQIRPQLAALKGARSCPRVSPTTVSTSSSASQMCTCRSALWEKVRKRSRTMPRTMGQSCALASWARYLQLPAQVCTKRVSRARDISCSSSGR
mmetsp:Transcript_71669/g.226462  ORF Transcript_71669/g.226462 Transcript_71669/m.226462 type:complete len:231 (+) Transcript_71669:2929-3621(+)